MEFENLLSDLRNTSKPSEKQAILKAYDCDTLRYMLRAAYDPFTLFNVNIKPKEMPAPANQDLGEVFDEAKAVLRFCEHSKSAKQNREMVIKLLEKLNSGSQELFVGILNKNWKSGVSAKTVVKLFPGLIKQFTVQLANTYDPNNKQHQLPVWFVSYKLDGVRCIALRDEGIWTLYSRKGKEFLTVEHLKDQLENLYSKYGWTFFDGELYKHGLKFEEIQGPVMAFTQGQISTMEYHCFVAGKAENFLAGENPNDVDVLSGPSEEDAPMIKFVGRGKIAAILIEEELEKAFEKGYEGIMLRDPDQLYDYKRSHALLKLKRRLDGEDQGEIISDCIVTSIEYNEEFPIIEDGELHTEKLLNRIWVQQEDGTLCKVGSGYSLEFRRKYTENPTDLIGKIVEIKHQEWGANGRMRFPRLIRVREDL